MINVALMNKIIIFVSFNSESMYDRIYYYGSKRALIILTARLSETFLAWYDDVGRGRVEHQQESLVANVNISCVLCLKSWQAVFKLYSQYLFFNVLLP